MFKSVGRVLPFLLLLLVLWGCSGGEGDALSGEKPSEAWEISYGISNPWDSLMPYNSVSGSNYSRIIYDKIYDRLVYVQADGTCLPRGATSWETADDGMSIVFHLNEKAAFHDGTPVTAKHWADTMALITNPDCPSMGRASFSDLTGTDEGGMLLAGESLGAVAVDDYTLKLTMKYPVIAEEYLADRNRELYVLPTHLLADIPPEAVMEAVLWTAPIGSGPCVFQSEIVGSSLLLSANENYHLGAPAFDTLKITVMDKANLLTALLSGDLDYYTFGNSVSEDNAAIAEEAGFTVIEGEIPTTFYELMLNNESISEVKIRHAISNALDREQLCQQNAGSQGMVTYSSILPDSPYAGILVWQAQAGEADEARMQLEESGYDGRVYTLACTSARADTAALLQQQLQQAGISVEITTVDSATMFSGMYEGIYDMALASHTPGITPLWFVDSRFRPDNNLFRVQDLEGYVSRISAIVEEQDMDERLRLVGMLEAYLSGEMPFVPLWFSTQLHLESKTILGIDYPAASFSNENVWEWTRAQ